LKKTDIFKNKPYRNLQKYDLGLTKLITADEVRPFDGTLSIVDVPDYVKLGS
jgi:hypothetical protein